MDRRRQLFHPARHRGKGGSGARICPEQIRRQEREVHGAAGKVPHDRRLVAGKARDVPIWGGGRTQRELGTLGHADVGAGLAGLIDRGFFRGGHAGASRLARTRSCSGRQSHFRNRGSTRRGCRESDPRAHRRRATYAVDRNRPRWGMGLASDRNGEDPWTAHCIPLAGAGQRSLGRSEPRIASAAWQVSVYEDVADEDEGALMRTCNHLLSRLGPGLD